MKLRIVGTGAILSKNNSACYLINDKILFDIPNGICKEIKRFGIDLNNIKYVLLTHFHGDHFFDLPFFFLSKSIIKNSDVFVYTDKKGKTKIKKLIKLAFPNSLERINENLNIKYITLKKFNIDGLDIEKILVDHGNMKPAFGYIVTDKENTIGITGDSCYCEPINYIIRKSNYIICDCSLEKGNNKHMGINNIIELANKYPNKYFIVSHMNDNIKEQLLQLHQKNIIIPNDGDIIIK